MRNLHRALSYHPAIRDRMTAGQVIRIMVGYDEYHRHIAQHAFAGMPDLFKVSLLALEETPSTELVDAIIQCDLFVLLYNSSSLPIPSPNGPPFLAPIRPAMVEHWQKSVLFKDYGPHLQEAFAESLDQIATRNQQLIDIAQRANQIRFDDGWGNGLIGSLTSGQKWTSVDGMGNLDIVPGEIATHIPDLRGTIIFSGTFLSTIPFASKYKVVEQFFKLHISESIVTDFVTTDAAFRKDFSAYLERHPNHRKIEEFGIGTNLGVKQLYGRNAGFEERHAGLHLGLGGGALGSHHLDLIFNTGSLAFDDKIVFDGSFAQLDRLVPKLQAQATPL